MLDKYRELSLFQCKCHISLKSYHQGYFTEMKVMNLQIIVDLQYCLVASDKFLLFQALTVTLGMCLIGFLQQYSPWNPET